MKASLKFREQKNPLLRAKVPFKVGALPLSSGVAIGTSQEVAVHLSTFFPVGPTVKLAFKPNDASRLSVVLKMGLGPWGSPHGAPLSLKAELFVSPQIGDPLFTLHLKPRMGDLGVQKEVAGLKFTHSQQNVSETAIVPMQPDPTTEKFSLSTPPPSGGEGRTFPRRLNGNSTDKERVRSPSLDSVVIGSNFSLKIEGLDREWKGKSDKKQKAEGLKEHESGGDITPTSNGNGLHMQHDTIDEQDKLTGNRKSSSGLSFGGAQRVLQGCKFVAHSTLPIGKQAKMSITWGIKAPSDLFQHWDGSLPSLALSRLPSLLLDKISFEQVSPPVEKPKVLALHSGYIGGLLPVSFVEENQELAQVALLCFNLKRQLHFLYAENQVLKKSMEDMRSQVELRGYKSWSKGPDNGAFLKDQYFSSNLDAPRIVQNGREETRKNYRDSSRRDVDVEMKSVPEVPSFGESDEMCKELEKAIKGAANGSSGPK